MLIKWLHGYYRKYFEIIKFKQLNLWATEYSKLWINLDELAKPYRQSEKSEFQQNKSKCPKWLPKENRENIRGNKSKWKARDSK